MAAYADDHKADWKTLHLVIYEEFFLFYWVCYVLLNAFVY